MSRQSFYYPNPVYYLVRASTSSNISKALVKIQSLLAIIAEEACKTSILMSLASINTMSYQLPVHGALPIFLTAQSRSFDSLNLFMLYMN